MTAITVGSIVAHKGGEGPEMLVLSIGGGFAPAIRDDATPTVPVLAACQWWAAGNELMSASFNVEDLELRVASDRRAAVIEEKAQADIAVTRARLESEAAA